MADLNIGKYEFLAKDINMFESTYESCSDSSGSTIYFVRIHETQKSKYDFYHDEEQLVIKKLMEYLLKKMNEDGPAFARIGNFIININNVKDIKIKKDDDFYIVEIKFLNKEKFELYSGRNEEEALEILDSYFDQEAEHYGL
ncbi:MAG: hypothetical protein E7374_01115 [Clostridiales bacterium]|nr:hypothetical protein [Clostridiales bacterium]